MVELALGGALVLGGRADGVDWLESAGAEARACGDPYVPCVAALWHAFHHLRTGAGAAAREHLLDALTAAQRYSFNFAFNGSALLAPKDPSLWPALLRRLHSQVQVGEFARTLSRELEPTDSDGRFVLREADTIRLAVEGGIRIDADELSRMIGAAKTVEKTEPELAIILYESALALYRGEFLSETRYVRWAEQERLQKRTEFLGAAERVGTLHMDAQNFEGAARWAEIVLQQDPLWEGAYTILMEARRRLQGGLGVKPSARTAALFASISTPDSEIPAPV